MIRTTELRISPDGKRLILEVPIEYVIVEKPADAYPTVQDLLTRMQWKVFNLIRQGLTSKEIGAQLGVSERAIKFHKARIFGALDLRCSSEVMRRYPLHGERLLVEAK